MLSTGGRYASVGGRCQYHPDRNGIGVCVECRQVICAECTTQFDGVNRCSACLAALNNLAYITESKSDYRAASLFLLLLVFGLLFGGLVGLISLAKHWFI